MKFKFVLFCATLALIFVQVRSVRVLGIFPHIGKSHSHVFNPLMKSLAEKGHEVTVISHFPLQKPMNNYKDISLKGSIPIWEDAFDFDLYSFPYLIEKILMHVVIANELKKVGEITCEVMLKNAEVQAIKPGDYDVVVIEQFNSDCGLAIVNRLKVPFIGITSHVMMAWTYGRLGINTNPSYMISHYLGHGRSPNMLQTAESLIVGYWYRLIFHLFSQRPEIDMVKEYYDKDCPCLEEVARNMSMIMVYTYFPLMGAVPFAPNVLEIGGIHLEKAKTLNQDLEKYLNESKHGVILFSMGSMLRAVSWPEDKLKAFQEAFAELDEDVLWKWENDTMEGVPKNVRLQKWVPQIDVLRHKNVKAFITHAGMLGLTEAVDSGIPVVSIPMYGDQFGNAAAARDSGVGAYLEYRQITKETVLEALRKVLKPSVLEKAKKLSAIWQDRPMSPVDTAVYWVEHVARHGGSHLRPASADLPLYRYLLLDVIAFFVILGVLVVYINMKIYRFVRYLCCSTKKKSKKE